MSFKAEVIPKEVYSVLPMKIKGVPGTLAPDINPPSHLNS